MSIIHYYLGSTLSSHDSHDSQTTAALSAQAHFHGLDLRGIPREFLGNSSFWWTKSLVHFFGLVHFLVVDQGLVLKKKWTCGPGDGPTFL